MTRRPPKPSRRRLSTTCAAAWPPPATTMVSCMLAPCLGAGLYGAPREGRLFHLVLLEDLAALQVQVAAIGREREGDERLAALDQVVVVVGFRLLGLPQELARGLVGAEVLDRVARPLACATWGIEERAWIEQYDGLAI